MSWTFIGARLEGLRAETPHRLLNVAGPLNHHPAKLPSDLLSQTPVVPIEATTCTDARSKPTRGKLLVHGAPSKATADH